jgi:phosphatidate cytidylyltransferase
MSSSSFVQRLVTALVLIPLVVAGVLFLPTLYLALILAAVVLLGGLEWTRLSGIHSLPGKGLYLLLLASALWLAHRYVGSALPAKLFFLGAGIWWLAVTLFLFRVRELGAGDNRFYPQQALVGFLVLVPAWTAITTLHAAGEIGPQLVVFLLVLIWVADSGAYFSGLRWGRIKLAPVVSPGKTREGLYGALAGAVLCGGLLFWLLGAETGLLVAVLLSVITALFSVVGDLLESVFKRKAGIKDSGNLLPGHGGVLDRIDSLTAAAPLFLLGLLQMGVV